MKQALEKVYTVFEAHDIMVMIPDNDADIKTTPVFFNASATIINSMMDKGIERKKNAFIIGSCVAVAEGLGSVAARGAARTTARVAIRSVAVGASIVFAVWDGLNIVSTWTTDSKTVKQIENVLEELE